MLFVSPKEKMFFAEHLSLLIRGGVPLAEALKVLRGEISSRSFKKALSDILERVLEGETLARGLGRHPKIFDKFFQNIVRVGEKSGTLEENLKYLSTCIRSQHNLQRKIKGALIYPILIITLAVIIVSLITFFVLPKIIGLLQSLEVELPLATRILIGSGTFLKQYWLWLLGGLFLLFFIFKVFQRLKFIRFYWHKLILSFPLFGKINRNLSLARFSRTFYTLFRSGMPILEALEVCADALPNEVYKTQLNSVRSEVERGEKISEVLKRFPKTFPLVFSQMILVGERSGALEGSLLYLAEFYEGEVDTAVKNLSGLLEPVLLIFVGLLVAFIALAIITPIYKLIGSLQGLR